MAIHSRFHYHSLEDLKMGIDVLHLGIPLSRNFAVFKKPLTIAGRPVWNRFSVHPMEGFDADPTGTPGRLSFRRYSRYATGGAAVIWFEATSVVPEARSNPGQFWLHAGNVGTYARLVQATRDAARREFGQAPLLILQLTHSGTYRLGALAVQVGFCPIAPSARPRAE